MGLLKGCLKLAGTAILGATTVASKVLEEVSNAAGVEVGSEIFGAAKNASMNGIKGIWSDGEEGGLIDDIDKKAHEFDESTQGACKRKMAETAKRAAEIAKKNGDMEKYEHYMEQYYKYL